LRYCWLLSVVVFMCLGLFGAIPGFHCLLFTDVIRVSGFPIWLFVTAGVYIVGGLAYATRIPECYFPGKFDIWVSIHRVQYFKIVRCRDTM
jgi:adiponectin receptor